jgi:hypothetical protein
LFRLTSRPLGFDPSNLAVVSFKMTRLPNLSGRAITAAEYAALTQAQHAARKRALAELRSTGWWLHTSGVIDRLAALPGVIGVAGGYTSPFLGIRTTGMVRPMGRPAEEATSIRQHIVSEEYFEVIGTPILRGRTFAPADRVGADAATFFRPAGPRPAMAAIVSLELERRFFDGDALGKQLVRGSPQTTTERVLNVVGVVPDTRWRRNDDEDRAAFYILGEDYHSINTFFVRSAGDAEPPAAAIRETLGRADPNIVVTSVAMMEDLVARSVADERFRAAASAVFGGAALGLAAVGLYGLALRRVADRRREIGVRLALGARPGDVRSLVFRDALRTIAIGLAVGLPAAFAASQVTQSFLYGVTPTAPHVFVIAAVVLALAAIVATLVPARRAAAIDPVAVLKE